MPQIFLFTDGTSTYVRYWSDPGDWNPDDNTVECLGAGGRGAAQIAAPQDNSWAGGGSGGGAYAKGVNINPAFPVPYVVQPQSLVYSPSTLYHTVFGSTAYYFQDPRPGVVQAECGSAGIGGNPQTAPGGQWKYPTGYAGGSGGGGWAQLGGAPYGGGGGGAAGPHGAGGNGTAANASTLGTPGYGDAGYTAAPGQGGAGVNGTQWGSCGCGSATWGGWPEYGPQNGGNYGAGAGGATGMLTGARYQAAGSPGLIVITYTPRVSNEIVMVIV